MRFERANGHYNLGNCYDAGYAVAGGPDAEEAYRQWRAAGELGHAQAACCVGYCLMMGDGVSQARTPPPPPPWLGLARTEAWCGGWR